MTFQKTEWNGYETWVNKETKAAMLKMPSSSNDEIYTVSFWLNDSEMHCECKGFLFRNSCKHVLKVRNLLDK